MRIFLFVFAMAFPAAANAEPVFLNCQWDNEPGIMKWTLDEGKGTATLGQSERKATFSADSVSVYKPVLSVGSETYRISRIDLSIEFVAMLQGRVQTRKHGTCEVDERKRAF